MTRDDHYLYAGIGYTAADTLFGVKAFSSEVGTGSR